MTLRRGAQALAAPRAPPLHTFDSQLLNKLSIPKT